MGAFKGLTEYLDEELIVYAKQFGYDDSNIVILEGKETVLKEKHLNIYNNLLTCVHKADKRSPIIYGKDLVASWIFEDLFIENIRGDKLNICLSGADRNRIILPNQRIDNDRDYIITFDKSFEIGLELVNDYTGFWYRRKKLHLRDNKYKHLLKEHNLLLAIALSKKNAKYTIFDFREKTSAKYIPSHFPYGGKPAYEMTIDRENLFNFSWDSVRQSLIQYCIKK